jgi:hypothetical protein
MPDVGGRQKEIAAAETRLGRELPPSVREWIAFSHDHPNPFDDLPGVRDFFCCELTEQPGISLAYDGFAKIHSAIHIADLSCPDPHIHSYRQEHDASYLPIACVPRPDFYFPTQPVTGWAFDSIVAEIYGWGSRLEYEVTTPNSLIPELERRISPRIQFGNSVIIEAENALIQLSPPTTYSARTRLKIKTRKSRNDEIPDVIHEVRQRPNTTARL